MTIAEALELRQGNFVLHKATLAYNAQGVPAKRPIRITEAWTNDGRTIVMLRCAGISSDAWMHATEFELTPAGMMWDKPMAEWVSREEFVRRKRERSA